MKAAKAETAAGLVGGQALAALARSGPALCAAATPAPRRPSRACSAPARSRRSVRRRIAHQTVGVWPARAVRSDLAPAARAPTTELPGAPPSRAAHARRRSPDPRSPCSRRRRHPGCSRPRGGRRRRMRRRAPLAVDRPGRATRARTGQTPATAAADRTSCQARARALRHSARSRARAWGHAHTISVGAHAAPTLAQPSNYVLSRHVPILDLDADRDRRVRGDRDDHRHHEACLNPSPCRRHHRRRVGLDAWELDRGPRRDRLLAGEDRGGHRLRQPVGERTQARMLELGAPCPEGADVDRGRRRPRCGPCRPAPARSAKRRTSPPKWPTREPAVIDVSTPRADQRFEHRADRGGKRDSAPGGPAGRDSRCAAARDTIVLKARHDRGEGRLHRAATRRRRAPGAASSGARSRPRASPRSRRPTARSMERPPRPGARSARQSAARSSPHRCGSGQFTWGVATIVRVPAAAAARASAIEPSIVSGPSSMPGSTWQWRSITGA